MKKAIIVIIILLLAVGGWYFFSQQEEGDMNGEEEIEEGDEPDENGEGDEEDIPYYEEEESSVISGPNEEKHETLTEVFGDVFEGSKLTSNDANFDPADPKFDYWGDMYYFVPDKIDNDDVKEVREKLEEEGFKTTSVDTGSEFYVYEYNFEMEGEEYSGRMRFVLGEGDINNKRGSIEIDFQIRN